VKYVFFIIALLIDYLLVRTLKLLDNLGALAFIFIFILTVGIIINFFVKKGSKTIKDIGWGMFYSSLTLIALIALMSLFMIFMSSININ